MNARLSIGGLLAVGLVGCTMKAKLKTETNQAGATLEVKVNVDPPASGVLTFSGNPAFQKLGPQMVSLGQTLNVSVPVGSLPTGKNTVAMHFEGSGKGLAKHVKSDDTLTFDRKAATPELLLMPTAAKAGGATYPCSGSPCLSSAMPFGTDGKLYVDMTNCDGCTVVAGPQTITVKGDPFPAAIDMMGAIMNVPITGLTGFSDAKITLKVTRGTDSGERNLEGTAPGLLSPILRRVAHGPLLFPGETPAAHPAKGAVLVQKDQGYFFRPIGAATIKDADLIGIATVVEKQLASCGVYEGTKTGQKVTVAHTGESYDITMYDRRTGKTVSRRVFSYDDKGCADTLAAKTVTSVPNDAQIMAWAKGLLH